MTRKEIDAEKAYADDLYKRRIEVANKARAVIRTRIAQVAAGGPVTVGSPPAIQQAALAAMSE